MLWGLVATGAFLWLRHRLERYRWWRFGMFGLLGFWAAVVLLQTVLRGWGEERMVSLIPFQCYITVFSGGEKELIRSALMNVLLFYPGGLLIRSLWPRPRVLPMVLGFLFASVTIELCQYLLGIGTTETDDVIHNTLGAALGILAARQYEKNIKKQA